MSGQFQADVNALTTFRDDVKSLVSTINGNTTLMSYIQALASKSYKPVKGMASFQHGPLDFGQEMLEFVPATNAASAYDANFDGFTWNLQKWLDALTVLAEAADAIANNYKDATSYEQVSAQSVQDAITNAPSPQQPTQPTQPAQPQTS